MFSLKKYIKTIIVLLMLYTVCENAVYAKTNNLVENTKSNDTTVEDLDSLSKNILQEQDLKVTNGLHAIGEENKVSQNVHLNNDTTLNMSSNIGYSFTINDQTECGETEGAIAVEDLPAGSEYEYVLIPAGVVIKPVITLLGNNPVNIAVGDTYNDAGANAIDPVFGNLNEEIERNNPVNTNQVGTYTVTYNVSNPLGESADEVERTVNVENANPFIMEVQVAAGDEFNLPLTSGATYAFSVNYGDGTTGTVSNRYDTDASHTYTTSGTYQIAINGTCERLYFASFTTDRKKVTKIIQWGDVGFTTMYKAFLGCINLTELPNGPITGAESVSDFNQCFYYNSITSIPPGLFDNTPNVTNFSSCFNHNSITSIPSGLFDNTPNVTRFTSCFAYNNITSIPSGLFDNTPNATYFSSCFSNNTTLTGNAPLLWNLFPAANGSYCFNGCTGLDNYCAIPESWGGDENVDCPIVSTDAFVMKVQVTSGVQFNLPLISGAAYNFVVDYGDGTTGTVSSYYDTDAFHTYTAAGTYQIQITGLCQRLYFNGYSYDATKVTKIIQWGDVGFTSMDGAFYGCANLSELPPGVPITGCDNVTDFSYCFYGCNLTSIPSLFERIPLAERFDYCFAYNEQLMYIPYRLFEYAVNADHFSSCFRGDISLTGQAPAIWNLPGVYGTNCFEGCTGLSNYNLIPSLWK